ncbi:MAG TPA: alpha/beta hydrolase [Steroidobacteraceae bacterium]|jgi:acetyl esterase/lipase|nr:alpha/beta hydrolase [Steroidobacteraceae bacterium]
MKLFLAAVLAATFAASASAESAPAASHAVVNIWPGAAPGSKGATQKEIDAQLPAPGNQTTRLIRNVVTPTLTVFAPAKPNGTALIVCPGGGYFGLMFNYEGTDLAEWLSARGVTAFVLKYRLLPTPVNLADQSAEMKELTASIQSDFDNNYHKLDAGRTLAVADGKQAIRYVRRHAAEWGVAKDRIGLMGFSAGAGLTMGVLLDHDAESRPDFAAPIYGYMDDVAPPNDAPPIFIVATQADKLVPSGRSVMIYQRWTAAHLPAELHLFEQGPHGFGTRQTGLPVDQWQGLFEQWLRSRGLITAQH